MTTRRSRSSSSIILVKEKDKQTKPSPKNRQTDQIELEKITIKWHNNPMSQKTAILDQKSPQTEGLKSPSLKLPKAILSTDLGNRQQATGNRQQATGNRQQANYTHLQKTMSII